MSWLTIIGVIIAVYLAVKVMGFMLKLSLMVIVVGGLYWLCSPYLGLPLPY